MKLVILFLMCSFSLAYASDSYAQTTTVNVEAQNKTVGEILKEIESQSDFGFFFNNKHIDLTRRISISSRNSDIFKVLEKVFGGTNVKYSVLDKKIVLTTVTENAAAPQQSVFRVTGKIVDETGEGVIGATVLEKATTNGIVTDMDGNFELNVSIKEVTLEVSYIGYSKMTVKAKVGTPVRITLKEDTEVLDEVVVVGYGTQKKANLTGAVSQISMDKVLGNRPVSTVGTALQGAIPGLVVSPSATPGGDSKFNIRGTTSINGGGPLVLIDNVPGDVNLLNPEDIESVSVLKDAASAAIYGARSAFGVVLITTKKAKKNERLSINYGNTLGWESAINLPEQVSIPTYMDTYQHAFGNTHYIQSMDMDTWRNLWTQHRNGSLSGVEESGRYVDPNGNIYFLNDADIMNQALNTGFQQTHNISATGGSDKITYRLSLGYVNNNGVLKGSKDVYERFNVSSYVSADITQWLTTALDFRYTKGDQGTPDGSGRIWNVKIPRFWPTGTVVAPDGTTQNWETPENGLMLAPQNHTIKKNPRIYSRTSIHPIEGLDFIMEYTYNGTETDIRNYNGYFSMMHPQNTTVTEPLTSKYINNKITVDYNSLNVYGSYQKSFGNHNFKAMAGFTQETSNTSKLNVNRLDMINPGLPSISGGNGEVTATDSYIEYVIRGGYGRLNYDYQGKYLVELNGRYDGSSRFPRANRFGFFPSASIGWQVGKENFMGWSKSWLNEFKLRASYGEIGNQAIADYAYMATMNPVKSGWIQDGMRPITLTTPGMVSSDFTWETVKTLDVGFDISALNNRLQASFDWYQRDTKGMLAPGTDFSAEAGAKAPQLNAANLRNRGWELTLNWREQIGDWGYRIGFNIYDSKTKITKYDNPNKSLSTYYEGQTLGEIWGYVTDGFYTIHDFVSSSEGVKGWQDGVWNLSEGVTSIQGTSPRPGDHKFANLNDDENSINRIDPGASTYDNPGDRKIIGNNSARFQFGTSLGGSWKGVDLSVFLQGTGKRDYWVNQAMRWGFGDSQTGTDGVLFKGQEDCWMPSDMNANTIEGWTPVNENPTYYRYYGNLQNKASNRRVQTHYLTNAAYLRIKNITLGYTLPKSLVRKIGLSNAKVYCSGENLFTFSNVPTGFDPERLSWEYPFYRTISFGFNVTL